MWFDVIQIRFAAQHRLHLTTSGVGTQRRFVRKAISGFYRLAITGAFDPSASPPIGFYSPTLWDAEGEVLYNWISDWESQLETSHLFPFRRQDFALGASGLALEELEGKTFRMSMDAVSSAPEVQPGTASNARRMIQRRKYGWSSTKAKYR